MSELYTYRTDRIGNSWFAAFFFIFFWSSCAQIVAPTGGPKDVIPARVLSFDPPHQSNMFRGQKFSIRFNEYIQLQNPGAQVIISPPLESKPEFVISGKRLDILFTKPLRPNTTYTVNFGNAVVDLHESNSTSDLFYSFSTGEYIDSLYVKGRVFHAFDNVPVENCLIALYDNRTFTDSTVLTDKPDYFGVSRPGGLFRIQNLPDSLFHLVAYVDENKNLKYDKNERLGFVKQELTISDTPVLSHEIALFTTNPFPDNLLIDSFSRRSGRAYLVISNPDAGTRVQHRTDPVSYTWFKRGKNNLDTFLVFNADTTLFPEYTIRFRDSVYMLRIKKPWGRPFPEFKQEVSKQVQLTDSLRIVFTCPVSWMDTSRIILKEDTIPVFYQYELSPLKDKLSLFYPWKEQFKYSFELKDSALRDIYGQYNIKSTMSWTSKSSRDYSTLLLKYTGVQTGTQYLVQLWNEGETELIKELVVNQNGESTLEYMVPGMIKVKFIEDRNQNGKWDTGDYLRNIQPERVFYLKDKLVLRAYWDLEQILNFESYFPKINR